VQLEDGPNPITPSCRVRRRGTGFLTSSPKLGRGGESDAAKLHIAQINLEMSVSVDSDAINSNS
jgi:hypothetical protein